ncbi:MAG TPA: hypothetical protein V6C86_25140 [Oculatellaceae cyanobacterium]
MATLSYPTHSRLHTVRPNKLMQELPTRLGEVRYIHEINYGLLLSSLLITFAVMALAWFIVTNRTHNYIEPNPTADIATIAPASAAATVGRR